jgi:hypothetical protein
MLGVYVCIAFDQYLPNQTRGVTYMVKCLPAERYCLLITKNRLKSWNEDRKVIRIECKVTLGFCGISQFRR